MINKQTKMILGLAAVGVAGYFILKSMKPKTQNFTRRKSSSVSSCTEDGSCEGPQGNICGESCVNGVCFIAQYGPSGNKPIGYIKARCAGTSESTQVLGLANRRR